MAKDFINHISNRHWELKPSTFIYRFILFLKITPKLGICFWLSKLLCGNFKRLNDFLKVMGLPIKSPIFEPPIVLLYGAVSQAPFFHAEVLQKTRGKQQASLLTRTTAPTTPGGLRLAEEHCASCQSLISLCLETDVSQISHKWVGGKYLRLHGPSVFVTAVQLSYYNDKAATVETEISMSVF